MVPVELYGKCRELGYCDCKGFFGCVDDEHVKDKPDSATLKAASRQHKTIVSENDIRRYAEGIPEWSGDKPPRGSLVECQVCGRSHQPNHVHLRTLRIAPERRRDDYHQAI